MARRLNVTAHKYATLRNAGVGAVGALRFSEVVTRPSSDFRPVAESLVVPSAHDQDRAAIVETRDGVVLVVADGAGGTPGGTLAAEMVISDVCAAATSNARPDWTELLRQSDIALRDRGWTTAVIVEATGDSLIGASIGDSRAWLYRASKCAELTEHQSRKPLLGSGRATPIGFTHTWSPGDLLLLASDGVCDYLALAELGRLSMGGYTLRELIEQVKLPTGRLIDDASLIRCCLVPRRNRQPTEGA